MKSSLWLLLLTPLAAPAGEPAETAAAQMLRDVLLKKLPSPALDTRHNWGQQKEVITGYDLKRRGPFDWDGRPKKEKKNDGHWTHTTIDLKEPAKNLTLELKDLATPEPGRLTFHAALRASDVNLKLHQQVWKHGVRLLSDETRATCKAAIHMNCELVQRLDSKPGATLPDVVLTLKVSKAELFYDDLRIHHTLGLGGDAAKLIGEATHKLISQVKPSLEKDLLAKANAAVLKAANDKEVRLGLSGLMKK